MNKKDIVLLELFSGIGGFAKGFQDAGYNITNHYFSEIDKHAIANYKHNFKNSNYVGSVTDVRGSSINPPPDIITFGSPCQDFSLAGKRAGMDGSRSSLVMEAIRLISETKPSVFIWENVKGAFSSNDGADFWAIITAFTNIGGYRLEWQLCNTSWFLPQNRERIYLVGHLTGRSEPGVFPFTKSVGLHSERHEKKSSQLASTLNAGDSKSWVGNFIQKNKSKWKNGINPLNDFDEKYCPKIKQINDKQNFGKSTKQQDRIYDSSVLMACIPSSRTEGKLNIQIGHVSRTDEAKEIRKNSMKQGVDYSPFQERKIEFKDADIINTITCATQKDNIIKVASNTKKGFDIAKEGDSINLSNPNSETRRGRVGVGVAQTLDTQCNQAVVKSVATPGRKEKNQNGSRFKENESFTLCSQDQHGVQINDSIRRLTEIECERLQGFPDDWTKFGVYLKPSVQKYIYGAKKRWRTQLATQKLYVFAVNHTTLIEKEIPKTQRYKMCGNAVTTDLPREIAKRLKITNQQI